jgi:hypothetical protein
MPLLAFDPGPEKLRDLDLVTSTDGIKGIGYLRLSPFSERSRAFIKGIFNLGYYPDDQFTNQPNMELLKQELSTKSALQ